MSLNKPLARCRHCGGLGVNRPRGLCWKCYYTPGLRELYPSTSKFAKRGIVDKCGTVPLAAESTRAKPGTEAKVALMGARALLGQAIFHPLDIDLHTLRS